MELIEFVKSCRELPSQKVKGMFIPEITEQEEFVLNSIEANDKTILGVSRQIGTTSLMSSYIAWSMLFKGGDYVVSSSKFESAAQIKNLVRHFINKYNNNNKYVVYSTTIHTGETIHTGMMHIGGAYTSQFKPAVFIKDNKRELSLVFENRLSKNENKTTVSRLLVYSCSSDMIRGTTLNNPTFFIDNAAYCPNVEDMYSTFNASVCASEERNSKIILASVPKIGSYFNRLASFKNWSKIELHYSTNPELFPDEKIRKIKNTIHTSTFIEEYEIPFDNPYVEPENQNKEKTVPAIRITTSMYDALCRKLIEKDVNVSEYIRELLTKDLMSQ